MRPRLFLGLLLFLAPLAAPGLALAQPPPGGQPLDRLLPQIRRAYPGQFLDAEGVTTGGSPHYHLKWLTPDGRVMWLDADARTGRIQRLAPGRDSFDAPRMRAEGDAPRFRAQDNDGGPPDRGAEGPGFNRGYGGQDAPRFGNRPNSNQPYERYGNGRARNFGGGAESAQPYMRAPGGGFSNRGGGERNNFGGGSRSGRDFGNGRPRGREPGRR